MKIFLITIFTLAAVQARPNRPYFDRSLYVPVQEVPGFWDDKPMFKHLTTSLDVDRRIVGGDESVPHAHPYQVALYLELAAGGSFCGGSIINLQTVLTAAHCTTKALSVFVVAGAHNVDDWWEPSQQWREEPAANIRVHPNYNPQGTLNDVSTIFIRTEGPFDLTPEVQPIQLPRGTLQSQSFAGEIGRSTGWGKTAYNSTEISSVLRYVDNTIITNTACAAVYGIIAINANKICTETTGGRGTCQGDSGGVLSVLRDGVRIQVGIHSFGYGGVGGCQAGYPSAKERVSGHLSWIDLNSA